MHDRVRGTVKITITRARRSPVTRVLSRARPADVTRGVRAGILYSAADDDDRDGWTDGGVVSFFAPLVFRFLLFFTENASQNASHWVRLPPPGL